MKFFKKILIFILIFLLTFVIFYLAANLTYLALGGSFGEYRRCEKFIPISISIAASYFLFTNKYQYYKSFLLLSILYSSSFFILYLSNSQILFKSIVESLAFNCSLSLLIISTVALFKARKVVYIISALLTLITFLPNLIYWAYYSIYNTFFTTDSLIAIMQTNLNESFEFIHSYANFYTFTILIIGLLVIFFVSYKIVIVKNNTCRPLLLGILIILSLLSCYASLNNIFTGPLLDFKLLQDKYGDSIKYKPERLNSIKQNLTDTNSSTGIYILVIGESHNKLYNSTYNYKVNSTPWLKSMETTPNLILFNNAYSNYTQTVQALTYALTLKNQYNSLSLDKAPSLIEIANVAGYKTVWLSNQGKFSVWDTGVSLIANEAKASKWVNNSELRVHSNDKKSNYDGSLIPELKNLSLSNKMLIVIHLYGSHSTYEDRFPKEYAKFHGLGDKNVDDYVNSIYYNDHIMHEILDYAKTMPNFKGLLYFSDHSEAVNHGGHSATNYRPDMVCIPMYMYLSDSYIKEYPKEFAALKKAQDYTFTNDLITNTMLSIMHIKLKNYYEPDNDLANPEYNHDFTRFRTLYGRAPLTDWHTLKPE